MNALPIDYTRFQSGYELSHAQQIALSVIVGVALLAIAIGLILFHTSDSTSLLQGLGEMKEVVPGVLIGVGGAAVIGVLGYLGYLGIHHHLIKAAFEHDDKEIFFAIRDEETCFWEFPLFGTPDEMRVHIKKGNSVESHIVFVVEEENASLPEDLSIPYITRKKLEQCRMFQESGQISFCKLQTRPNKFNLKDAVSIQT